MQCDKDASYPTCTEEILKSACRPGLNKVVTTLLLSPVAVLSVPVVSTFTTPDQRFGAPADQQTHVIFIIIGAVGDCTCHTMTITRHAETLSAVKLSLPTSSSSELPQLHDAAGKTTSHWRDLFLKRRHVHLNSRALDKLLPGETVSNARHNSGKARGINVVHCF